MVFSTFVGMKSPQYLFFVLVWSAWCRPSDAQSLTIYRSDLGVRETVELLSSILEEMGMKNIETTPYVPWQDEGDSAALPAYTVTFVDDTLSQMVLSCEVTVALDLPLKILVWDEYGDVYMGYFDPVLWRRKYLIEDCNDTLKHLSRLMSRVVNECLKRGYSAAR